MSEQYYENYLWREGKPYGVSLADRTETTYRIVADPYQKWITVEKYETQRFIEAVYDSKWIDFRTLKNPFHTAWSKTPFGNNRVLLRDENDRARFVEEYSYTEGVCTLCKSYTPNGQFLFSSQMHYTALGDSFNGVILYDRTKRPVMKKKYTIDQKTQEFHDLIDENWSP